MPSTHLSTGKKQIIFIIIIVFALIASRYAAIPFAKKIVGKSKSDKVSIEELKEKYRELYLLGMLELAIFIVAIAGIVLASKFLADKSWRRKDDYERGIRWGLPEVFAMFLVYVLLKFLLVSFFTIMKNQSIVLKNEIIVFGIFADPIIYLIILILGIYLIARKHGHPLEEIGLKSSSYARLIKIGVIAFIAYLPISLIISNVSAILFGLFNLTIEKHEVIEIYSEQTSTLIKMGIILALIISAPLFEEIFFRGFLYQSLKKAKGVVFAMLISAGIFAAFHFSAFLGIQIFFLGLLMAYLVEKTGSLVPGMVVHFLTNFIAALALIFGMR